VNEIDYAATLNALTHPDAMHPWSDVGTVCIPPTDTGIYGWWFSEVPPQVPIKDCVFHRGHRLLYVGIGDDRSLKERLSDHCHDDASRSTLRKTLGCLLADVLDLSLIVARWSRDKRGRPKPHYGFAGEHERALSAWMRAHLRVAWVACERPIGHERRILGDLYLPLNEKKNTHCPFYPTLMAIKKRHLARAKHGA
jgi:hypothetical protein